MAKSAVSTFSLEKPAVILKFGFLYTHATVAGSTALKTCTKTPLLLSRVLHGEGHSIPAKELDRSLLLFLQRIYAYDLLLSFSDQKVIIVEGESMPDLFREAIARVFTVAGVPRHQYVRGSICAMLGSGISSGLLIDMGFRYTRVIPILHGLECATEHEETVTCGTVISHVALLIAFLQSLPQPEAERLAEEVSTSSTLCFSAPSNVHTFLADFRTLLDAPGVLGSYARKACILLGPSIGHVLPLDSVFSELDVASALMIGCCRAGVAPERALRLLQSQPGSAALQSAEKSVLGTVLRWLYGGFTLLSDAAMLSSAIEKTIRLSPPDSRSLLARSCVVLVDNADVLGEDACDWTPGGMKMNTMPSVTDLRGASCSVHNGALTVD